MILATAGYTLPQNGISATAWGRRVCAILAAVLLAILLIATAVMPAGAAERRIALVVGNGAYSQTPLLNTINDARAMSKTLARLGFKVTTKLNVTQRDMHRAIVDFGRELGKGGVGLFYYAGHAVQIRGRNYMIPIGASISVEDHVEPESVDLNKVFARMGGARNKLNIVVLDSCRDNPFGDSFRFYSEGLAQPRAPANTFVAYAAAPGEVASDGTGENSFYTGALVKELMKEGSAIEETFKQVRTSVMAQTDKFQVPWTASSITQEFYFNPRPPKQKDSAGDETSKAIDREVVFWQSISNSTRIGDYEAYLRQFPEGTFADLVRGRLTELQRKKATGRDSRSSPPDRARTDPEVVDVIDRTMEEAKTRGEDYGGQIAAAVEALNSKRREFEENERKAAEARREVEAAIREKADKKYEKVVAEAQVAAAEAETAQVVAISKKAEQERQSAIQTAQALARKASADLLEKTRLQAETNARRKRAQAEEAAKKQIKIDLALAKERATASYDKAMAAAIKRADQMRQRMIETTRRKAETIRNRALSDARMDADENFAAAVAQKSSETNAEKEKILAAFTRRAKATDAKLMKVEKKRADENYRKALARGKKEAAQARRRSVEAAERTAAAVRQRQIASLKSFGKPNQAAPKVSLPKPVKDLMKKVSPDLRQKIEVAVAKARRNGVDEQGQIRVAWAVIKGSRTKRAAEPARSTNKDGAGRSDATVVKSEIQKIVDQAMRNAGNSGKNHQSQVQAALDAVKRYRAKEAEKTSLIGSVLGKWRSNPELSRIIDAAMADAKASGKNYLGQVRAALDAIKEFRAKSKGPGGT